MVYQFANKYSKWKTKLELLKQQTFEGLINLFCLCGTFCAGELFPLCNLILIYFINLTMSNIPFMRKYTVILLSFFAVNYYNL